MANEHATSALDGLDRVLAEKPHMNGDTLSAVTHELCLLRDELTKRQTEAGPTTEMRRRIAHVNAIISVVLAVHFPLGSVPWEEVTKAREWLSDLVAEVV